MKNHLGTNCEVEIKSNSKVFCEDTKGQKVVATICKNEHYIDREEKISESPGKPRKFLSKNEVKLIDTNECRFIIRKLIFSLRS